MCRNALAGLMKRSDIETKTDEVERADSEGRRRKKRRRKKKECFAVDKARMKSDRLD